MGFKNLVLCLVVIGCAAAQSDLYRVCVPSSRQSVCQSLSLGDSRVQCVSVDTRVECAMRLANGQADLGVFSEEEMILLSQMQPTNHRVIANIRHQNRPEQFAFETVAVVPASFTGGLDGLRDSGYCHPGFDLFDIRWSPRVLRTMEQRVARTDRCPEETTAGRTFEELEIATLSAFFRAGCRPGAWSHNATLDAQLKRDFPNLCSLCNSAGTVNNCSGYTYDMGLQIAGVDNSNRHIQALECLVRQGGNLSYVAWQHVREYFQNRATDVVDNYALLCEDGTLQPLSAAAIGSENSPCSWVRQPWGALVASTTRALTLISDLRIWWPNGDNPGGPTWQSLLFDTLVGGPELRVNVLDAVPTAQAYVASARNISDIDATTSCMPIRRWCTLNDREHAKCMWVRRASHILGIEPTINCQQRENIFLCLEDIRDSRADFMSLDSNYGYLARVRYNLGPVRLLQNSRATSSRVAALVKESSVINQEITRFENLRDTRACFPEFGGIAFVAFIRTAHEWRIINERECNYARAVGEFFEGACAPGALDATHSLSDDSTFNASVLCTSCRNAFPVQGMWSDFTCAADHSNSFFSTNGTLACLADPDTHVAFIETQNLEVHINNMGLNAANFRALCRNNSLADLPGVRLDDNCLLALVINEEVLSRRNDPQFNSQSSLLDLLERYFGYNAATSHQLINFELFSPFDGVSNLLFLDTAIGFTVPSINSTHEPARNYFELFSHLDDCTSGSPGLGSGNTVFSFITLIVMTVISRWVL